MEFSFDEIFAARASLTNDLVNDLNKKVNPFGYIIYDVLVLDIIPDQSIRNAMNDVVATEKERIAATNRAQAEKAAKILQAEAEAKTRELEGEGIAAARRAIIEGLRKSVDDFHESVPDLDSHALLMTVLMTQYMDTIKEAATHGGNTFILPSNPSNVASMEEQMRAALLSTKPKNKPS